MEERRFEERRRSHPHSVAAHILTLPCVGQSARINTVNILTAFVWSPPRRVIVYLNLLSSAAAAACRAPS
ncbi:unnamed protein product [Linum trigynum]|uniref:Uncharacterized protein n=1 Tax=Linum trigynum TaxID=586398 RepID=A0AAV2FES3_9ROSI